LYEAIASGVGSVCGVLGAYMCCCCCSPYKRVTQGRELVVTRFGRYKETLPAGLHYLKPLIDEGYGVSKCTHHIDLPEQSVLTKDTVTAHIDGSIYYNITDAYKVTFYITDVKSCLNGVALSALRACFASHTLQDCLEHRDKLAQEIRNYMIEHTADWGISVSNMVIKDIKVSDDMQRHLSAKATAQREAAAKVIDAQGDVDAAKLLRTAADMLNTPAALQIRYLETLKNMAENKGTKIIFVPLSQCGNIAGMAAAIQTIHSEDIWSEPTIIESIQNTTN